jgi:hypothetical protein
VIGSGRQRIIPGTGPVRGHCDAIFKRLEDGGFPFPMPAGEAKEVEMTAADLQLVLQGIDPQKVKRTKRYQRPATVE